MHRFSITRFLSSISVFAIFLSILCIPASANDMNADATFEEGMLFFSGDGVIQDIPKGIDLVLKAANAGSGKAMVQVGLFYSAGLGKMLSDDYDDSMAPELALSWYEKAAEAGEVGLAGAAISSDAFSYFLGSDGGFIQEDDAVALVYFQKAADLGDPSAINMMVAFYTYGFGVEQDPDKALELSSKLADQGDEEARLAMEENAYAYYAGTKDGVDINFATAFKYYMKLTEYGNERAMYNVGLLYEYGLGVSQDHEKAIEWLTKAQETGYEPAKVILTELNKAS